MLTWAAAAASGGMMFQFGCGAAGTFLRNFNPCVAVLNCDPVAFEFATSGYRGPGVDINVDPACTFPPFCPDDPFVGTIDDGG